MTILQKAVTALLLTVLIWLGGYMCFTGSALIIKPRNPDEITDAIVVLTGGQMRIETGLELFAQGRAGHLFITGVHPKVGKHEIIEKWSGTTALPPCCITIGHNADTTVQNAAETKEWLADKDYDSIRLVTANFHMNRARVEFSHALPGVKIISHPIVQPNLTITKWRFWELCFIEYHKTLFRWTALLFAKPQEVRP